MSKFKVGDIVVGNKFASGRYGITKTGYVGTVTKVRDSGDIRLNDRFDVDPKYFDLDTPRHNKIIITTDGATTLARLYEGNNVIKSAKAICSPADTFDFNIGAQLAFNRLVYGTDYHPAEVKLDKPKFKAGDRVRVIGNTNGHDYAIGDIVTLCGTRQESTYCHKFYWKAIERGFLVREDDIEPCTEPESTEPKLIVTKKMLEDMGACSSGVRAFMDNFPSGEGEFSEVFDKATEIGRGDDAHWLERRKFMVEQGQGEPKQEPVKLYCVKEPDVSWVKSALTVGKVYEFDGNHIEYDDGIGARFNSFERWRGCDPNYAACLIPLVKRPAKVGEWVYALEGCPFERYAKGQLLKILKDDTQVSDCWNGKAVIYDHQNSENYVIKHERYLVLDGYKPEYYSGKVVCVEATDLSVTVGKAYTVENGIFTWDDGTRSNTKASTIEQFNNWFVAAKFIEFKGE